MYVRFWGTRGSIASPGEGTVRYGGNTSCVELRAGDGTVIVLDCGTGARDLGLHLVRTMPSPLRLHLFIGHTHWDHIQGFPFFVPAFLPGAELNVYAPLGFQQSLEEAMSGQMEYSYFPVKLRDLRSRIHFSELEEGFFRVGDVLVETQYLNHTAPTIAYRMSNGGATVAYVTDHEPFWKADDGILHHPGDQRHIAFLRGADLVIHDAQYTDEQYTNRRGLGPLDDRVRHRRRAGRRRQAPGPVPSRPHPRRRHDGPHGGHRESARGRVGQRCSTCSRRVRAWRSTSPGARARRRCPRSRPCVAG